MAEKLKKMIDGYYYFFDHKLKNTTIIIGLVGTLILIVWIFIWWTMSWDAKLNAKSNILEIKPWQIMEIWWQKYILTLETADF